MRSTRKIRDLDHTAPTPPASRCQPTPPEPACNTRKPRKVVFIGNRSRQGVAGSGLPFPPPVHLLADEMGDDAPVEVFDEVRVEAFLFGPAAAPG